MCFSTNNTSCQGITIRFGSFTHFSHPPGLIHVYYKISLHWSDFKTLPATYDGQKSGIATEIHPKTQYMSYKSTQPSPQPDKIHREPRPLSNEISNRWRGFLEPLAQKPAAHLQFLPYEAVKVYRPFPLGRMPVYYRSSL